MITFAVILPSPDSCLNHKLKWAQANKRLRRDEPLCLQDEVQLLYSYNLQVDDSSSDDSDHECRG
eukprot:scaffold45786_cov21-Prasinocladus_malaysianus.AAC.1